MMNLLDLVRALETPWPNEKRKATSLSEMIDDLILDAIKNKSIRIKSLADLQRLQVLRKSIDEKGETSLEQILLEIEALKEE